MNLAVLECEYISDSPVPAGGGYTELFAELLSLHPDGDTFRIATFEAHQGRLPGSVTDADAYLITGSYAGVYDDYPWIQELTAFTREAHAAGLPIVGICFGHQVLAHALGGTVQKADVGWGLGVMETALSHRYPWMGDDEPATVELIYMHQDQVTSLPDAAVPFASTELCPYAGFTVGHPEFTPQLTERLIGELWGRFPPLQAQAAITSLERPTDHRRLAGWLTRFLTEHAAVTKSI